MSEPTRDLRLELSASDAELDALERALLKARAGELTEVRRRGVRLTAGYGDPTNRDMMDDEARRVFSVGARQHAEAFGWDRTVGGVMDVYADAVRAAARGEGLPIALVR